MPTYNSFHLDQHRNISPLPLLQSGPTIPVSIALSKVLAESLATQGAQFPQPINTTALIDTGASHTCVDYRLLDQLSIEPTGAIPVTGATGPAIQRKYPCSLHFPGTNLPGLDFSFVIGGDLARFSCKALIGRDVLAAFLLVYNGPTGMFTLSV